MKKVRTICWLSLIFLTLSVPCFVYHGAVADESFKKSELSASELKPLVIYYSRGGTTRIIAREIAENLSADITEIKSKRNRQGFFGILTCVFDQLFDRDDDLQPVAKDIKAYNPIIIASPIWIHKISSPARTFIKNADLRGGKNIYIILTYNGNQSEEDEQEIKTWLASHGISLKGFCKIITKQKTEEDLKKQAHLHASCVELKVAKR